MNQDFFMDKKKEEVIKDEYLNDYNEGMDFFFSELVRLNKTRFTLNKIKEFPFDIICLRDDTIFFNLVANNFFEYSLIMIKRLVEDNSSSDTFTIKKFRNNIVKQYIKKEYKNQFCKKLKSVKFNSNIKDILKRINTLRNKRLAHGVHHFIENPQDLQKIDFDKFNDVVDQVNDFYKGLSIDTDYLFLPVPYSGRVKHPKRTDTRTDIDKILDSLAKNSHFINSPEWWKQRGPRGKELWEKRKKELSDKKIKIMNKFRRKFDLPEI